MRVLVLAAAFAATLCGASMAQTPTLPAPVADGVQAVGVAENQSVLFTSVGARIAVTLVGKPSTGAAWIVTQKPIALSDPQRTTGPIAPPPSTGRPLMGASRWEVFTFEVLSAGEEVLRLEQRSVQGAVLATFEVTVVAEAN